jgi:hypothetical protein
MIPPDNYIVAQAANKVLLAPPAARPFYILPGVEGAPVASAEPGGRVKEKSDPRENEGFFLNVPEKLDDPFPDLAYFRENRPVFYHEGFRQWVVAYPKPAPSRPGSAPRE